MQQQKAAIYFVVVAPDRLIIPCFEVARSNTRLLSKSFMQEWKEFIRDLQAVFSSLDSAVKSLKEQGFTISRDDNFTCVLPSHFRGGFVHNDPDLFNASHEQILAFLDATGITLDELKIKNSKRSHLVQFKIHPTTFINLSVKNSAEFARIAEEQNSCSRVWISILSWWKYADGDSSNCDGLVQIIETHCLPAIYRCNNFLSIYARFVTIGNECHAALNYMNSQKQGIVWDEDLISEVATHSLCECKDKFDNDLFLKELRRRGV